MCLAKNIRYLRKRAGYSQEYLADLLGYKSFTTIQKWESGIAEPSILVLRKLSDLFGIDITAMTTVDIERQELSLNDSKAPAMGQELLSMYSDLDPNRKSQVDSFIRFQHGEWEKGKDTPSKGRLSS